MHPPPARSVACACLLVLVAGYDSARGDDLFPPALYAVTTETVMPHLEENLRYATTHARRCWHHQDLAVAFPILNHPALQGCRLDPMERSRGALSYTLVCGGNHGTTGTAHWDLGSPTVRGTLDVKLGGKNMTFFQRITATPVGTCDAQAP